MSTAKDRRKINAEAEAERLRREKERREFKEAQEKDSLLRTFKRLAGAARPPPARRWWEST